MVTEEKLISTGANQSYVKFAEIDASSSGDTELVAASTIGQKIRVLTYTFVSDAAVSVKFKSDSTDITGAMPFPANGGVSTTYSPVGHFETAADEALNINLSGAANVAGHVTYMEV